MADTIKAADVLKLKAYYADGDTNIIEVDNPKEMTDDEHQQEFKKLAEEFLHKIQELYGEKVHSGTYYRNGRMAFYFLNNKCAEAVLNLKEA